MQGAPCHKVRGIRLRPYEIHLAAQMVSGLEQIKGCVVVAEQPLRLAKIVEEPSAEAASTDVARKVQAPPDASHARRCTGLGEPRNCRVERASRTRRLG